MRPEQRFVKQQHREEQQHRDNRRLNITADRAVVVVGGIDLVDEFSHKIEDRVG